MPAKTNSRKDTLLEKAVILGSSLAYLTKGATDELIDVLERNKIISTKQGKEVVEKMKSDLKGHQAKAQKTVQSELSKVIDQLGLATKKDIEALKRSQTRKTASKSSAKKTTK